VVTVVSFHMGPRRAADQSDAEVSVSVAVCFSARHMASCFVQGLHLHIYQFVIYLTMLSGTKL
jgi:hypothetical protein